MTGLKTVATRILTSAPTPGTSDSGGPVVVRDALRSLLMAGSDV